VAAGEDDDDRRSRRLGERPRRFSSGSARA
jgi:hypothetical protein